MKRTFFTGFLALLVFSLNNCTLAGAPKKPDRPNVLLILVDDLGKEWISAYGAERIETPNVDHLAETGMTFHNAYSMPQCTPTRLTLLTGQYPFRHGWTNHFDVPRWGSGAHFDPQRNASLPSVLRNAGYATAIAGKWQIDDFRVEPLALHGAGFDAWSVWTGGEGGNLQKSHRRYQKPYIHEGTARGTESSTRREFGPDRYTNHLIEFIKNHREEPMFLYYPMCLTHTPFVSTPAEPEADSKRSRFKAMVRYMDQLVGRLTDALKEHGLRDETIVIFTTDNGTSKSIIGERNGRTIRGAKSERSEPGVAMPFIVSGPGMVPEGVETNALTDFTDLLPTLAELAGTQVPDRWTVDGRSIAPLLLGNADDSPRDWILSQGGDPAAFRKQRVVPKKTFDKRVIRDKRWKLWVNDRRKPVKLFDMKNDPMETKNLINSDREDAQAAKKRLMNVIRELPETDAAPRYDPNPAMPWDKFDYGGLLKAPNRRFRTTK